MCKLLITTLSCLFLLIGAQAQSISPSTQTHVFWYNCIVNNYNLQANPGPALPTDIIKHEGMIMTTMCRQTSGNMDGSFRIGNHDCSMGGPGFCAAFWSKDLMTMSGLCTTAMIRGEYDDDYARGCPFCVEGAIKIKIGVADFSGNINGVWGNVDNVPPTTTWMDPYNLLNWAMTYSPDTTRLMCEDTMTFVAPAGSQSEYDSPLDKHFAEFNCTKQVNWILAHTGANKGKYSGQYALVFLVNRETNSGGGSIALYSDESGNTYPYTNAPWTSDGNTMHLVAQMIVNNRQSVIDTPTNTQVDVVANQPVTNPIVTIKPDSTETTSTNLRKLLSVDIKINDTLAAALSSVTLRFDYSKIDLNGLNEKALRVYCLNASVWDAVDGTVDTATKTITVTVTRFSTYGLFIPINSTKTEFAHIPASPLMLSVAPNPFTVSAHIAFSIQSASKVDIAAYDIRGHRVRTLANGAYAAGLHQITFDGLNQEAKPLSTGIYFVRMKAGDKERMKQIQIMR